MFCFLDFLFNTKRCIRGIRNKDFRISSVFLSCVRKAIFRNDRQFSLFSPIIQVAVEALSDGSINCRMIFGRKMVSLSSNNDSAMNSRKTATFADAEKEMRPTAFSTMLKSAGSTCNLDCSYCYYLDKAVQYGGAESVMSEALLEEYVRQYITANETDTVTFCWHGGEPLLSGLVFYRRAMELQKRYAGGKRIENSIQTNAILINDEWCRFFRDNGFLVGVSLDGPEDIHDAFRVDKGGRPTWRRVMAAVEKLASFGVEFNTLSVVNKLSEGRGAEVYGFFKSIGSRYMQFLPAVEHVADRPDYHRPVIVPPDAEGARLAPWSVGAKAYGEFLNDIFDRWVVSDVGSYFVQMFDATLAQYCGVQPGVCSMGETCGDALVVEHNGDVYNCDHFVYPEYLLGNITERSLSDIYNSPERFRFGLAKRNSLPPDCLRCKFYFACRGECPKHRFDRGADGSPKNSLCEGLLLYFRHTAPYMEYMRDLLAARRSPAFVMPWARNRMGLM